MHQMYRDRALADGCRNALDRVGAHIAGNKDAGYAGFQREWIARQGPTGRPLAVPEQGAPGYHEPVLIAFNDAGQPVRAGNGADADEETARRHAFVATG